MASTWTSSIAIEKIADGEKTDTWGQITNRNFDIVDRATSGVGTIDLSGSAAAHTLSTTDGTTGDSLDDGQYRVLVLSGATEACTITVSPNDASKFYLVDNDSGFDVTFTQGSGSNVSVSNGSTGVIYCDGGGATAAVKSIIDSTTLTTLGITASAAELNVLDGVMATTSELNYNDITTLGTSQASKAVTADANGDVKFANAIVETVYSLTGTALDPNNGTVQTKTIGANTTFTDSLSSGESMSLHLTSASSYTITWPTITWITATGNNAPTLTAADTVVLFKISTTLYGVWIGSSA
ncbi:hypothetical protein N9117_02520 [Akkermansiaceae bacterium]|nr:hypothetical protein [Akkermansiaceae bacterium]